jgi:phosphatidylinositol glycan class V
MAETTRTVRAAPPNPNANPKQTAATSPGKPYFTWLLAIFTAWKSLLLLVAYASPGPGYDTSTRVMFNQYSASPSTWLARTVQDLTLRLTRWDAFYFTTSSERGHLFEQEWAFSWFMARLTAAISNGVCLY